MPTESSRSAHLALLAAFVCGALVAVQSRMNGELAESVGGFPAAWFSFGTGLLLLSLLLVSREQRVRLGRVPAALRSGRLRRWQLLGGVAGGLFVGMQTYAVPLVGVAAFLIAAIGGQTVSALVVDRFGLGPAPAQALLPARVAAASVAVVGVAIASTAGGAEASPPLLPVVLGFVVGMGIAVQQATNAQVTTVTGAVAPTAWLNFLTGTTTLLLVGVVPVWRAGWPSGWGSVPSWAWWGGLCGVAFIGLAAWAVQHSGVLLFGLVTITSQLAVALVLDLLDPATRDRVGLQMLLGIAVTVVAAVGVARAAAVARRATRVG